MSKAIATTKATSKAKATSKVPASVAHKAKFENLVSQIEAEFATGKWSMPFFAAKPQRNALTQKGYRGVNVLSLWIDAVEKEFVSREWMTFKQASEKGFQVKKGSKGSIVEFWSKIQKKDDEAVTSDDEKSFWFCKYYTVFNLSQMQDMDGNDVVVAADNTLPTLAEQQDLLLKFAEKTGVKIVHSPESGEAFYRPSTHSVSIPSTNDFKTEVDYLNTLAHELAHSTHRVVRPNWVKGSFGSVDYAKEEVVAELGAVFICSMLGIEKKETSNHAGYIRNWLNIAKESDSKFFNKAITEATKLAQYVWDVLYEDDSVLEQYAPKAVSASVDTVEEIV